MAVDVTAGSPRALLSAVYGHLGGHSLTGYDLEQFDKHKSRWVGGHAASLSQLPAIHGKVMSVKVLVSNQVSSKSLVLV